MPAITAIQQFRVNDVIVQINPRSFDYPTSYGEQRNNRIKSTRVYGAVDTFAAVEMESEPYVGQFLFTERIQPGMWANMSEADREEMTVKITEWSTWKRNIAKLARAGAVAALTRLVGEQQFDYRPKKDSDTKIRMRFDQKAGCGCGCSPGMVLEGQLVDANGSPVDIWIEKAPAMFEVVAELAVSVNI